jgi:hypothetical protein
MSPFACLSPVTRTITSYFSGKTNWENIKRTQMQKGKTKSISNKVVTIDMADVAFELAVMYTGRVEVNFSI